MAKMHSEGPVIDQVLEEFLTEQEERLALRTYGQYETVIELLREYLERYVTPSDPALAKAVDEAHRTGTEYAVCGLCPPREIVDNIDDFLSWFMVRKVLAGQDLMRAAGTVSRRLGKWLYEHNYIDGDDATVYQDETTRLSRSLPKATALRDKLVQWVDGLPKMKSEKTYDGHFQIVVITDRGWKVAGVLSSLSGEVPVPSTLRHSPEVGWQVSGVIAQTPQGLRWVEIWNVYPR